MKIYIIIGKYGMDEVFTEKDKAQNRLDSLRLITRMGKGDSWYKIIEKKVEKTY